MKRKSKTTKPEARIYWMVESEYGLDVKRHHRTICGSEEEAQALKKYLDLKNPYDEHEVVQLPESEVAAHKAGMKKAFELARKLVQERYKNVWHEEHIARQEIASIELALMNLENEEILK